MSWSIRCNFNRIQSYAQAVKAWQKAVVFPRSPTGPRGLVDKRKRHLTIQQTTGHFRGVPTEDIILRLYAWPVVTWHKDNSVTLCAYSTKSTGVFANHCTPDDLIITATGTFRVTCDGRTYKVDKQATFRERDNTWKPDSITPWAVPFVNRERAKQAFQETGYEEFRAWFKVYIQMASRPAGRSGWIEDSSIVTMLRDREWRDLVACYFPEAWNSPDLMLNKVRQAIYRECRCIDHKPVPFLG